jgi:hypothetical protein
LPSDEAPGAEGERTRSFMICLLQLEYLFHRAFKDPRDLQGQQG